MRRAPRTTTCHVKAPQLRLLLDRGAEIRIRDLSPTPPPWVPASSGGELRAARGQPLEGAGLEHRTPYAMRHTFASFEIAAGIPTFEIARMMGTSIEHIEVTYGHLLPDALERGRAALEAFDARVAATQASPL